MKKIFHRIFSAEAMYGNRESYGEMLSTKSVYSNLMRIAWPSVVEMVLMSMIGSVDTMMVGVLGPEAIAAVGLVTQPRMLMLTIFLAMNVGVTAVVSRRRGEERREDANHTLRNALVILTGLSILVMVFALSFSRPLLLFAGAEADTIDNADIYFRIMMLGLPLNALTMIINAAQRGVGNTKITLISNVASNLVNVVLNYMLITGRYGFPRMEVAGNAISSVTGFAVGFLLCLISVTSRRAKAGFLHLSFKDNWRLKKEIMMPVLSVGSSAMIEQVFMRVGFFAYAKIVAGLGTLPFAAHQVAMQFTSISFTIGDGLAVAGTALVGQMLGKKRPDLSFVYGRASQRIALVVSCCLIFGLLIFRYPLAGLFTSDIEVIRMAADVLIIVAIFQPFQTSAAVMAGCLRGAGDTKFVAFTMMVCVCLIRPILSIVAINVFDLGLMGAWASSLIDMIFRMSAVYIRFSSNKWSKIKV